jgi:hypothetical protein
MFPMSLSVRILLTEEMATPSSPLVTADECVGLIWSDRVNTAKSVGFVFVVVVFFVFSRRQSEQQSEQL